MPVNPSASPAVERGSTTARLSAEHCRALLAKATSGHLALSQGALPLVIPVTCAVHGEQLLVRAGLGLIGRAPLQPGVVAFQTGGTTQGGARWEVLVQGRAEPLAESPVAKSPPQLPLMEAGLTAALSVSMELVTGWQYGTAALTTKERVHVR